MNKRAFLQTLGGGVLAAMTSPLWSCTDSLSSSSHQNTKNWVWFGAPKELDKDAWKARFAMLKQSGIDAVLPQVYNGSEALFDHPHPLVNTHADILGELIPLAHEAGLEIHAWMWTMPCTNPQIVEKHPDWYAVNGLNESAHEKPAYVPYYKFLCPCNPEAQDFVQGNVKALAAYSELDGIHLDYVRLPDVILAKGLQPKYDIVQDKEYPQYDYSYSQFCREQFIAQGGPDPLELENPSSNEVWRQFRYDSVSNLVNNKLVPVAREAGKQITAAVFPNWQSVRQQWHKWDLDTFLPMLYHNFYEEDINWIGEQTSAALERLNHNKPIHSGLFVPSLSPEELVKAIDIAINSGAKGVSLFNLNAMTDEHWKQMANKIKSLG